MTPREHEQTLNVRLSDELRARGLDAKPEVMHGNRRVDVEVHIGPARIAVEPEYGQSAAKQREAVGDADRRLPRNQNLADVAVAVCYPEGTTGESLPRAELIWAIRDGGGGRGVLEPGQSGRTGVGNLSGPGAAWRPGFHRGIFVQPAGCRGAAVG